MFINLIQNSILVNKIHKVLLKYEKKKKDLEKAKYDQAVSEKYLNRIRWICRSKEKNNITLAYINMLFKGRSNAIKCFDDYRAMIFESTKKEQSKEKDPKRTNSQTNASYIGNCSCTSKSK